MSSHDGHTDEAACGGNAAAYVLGALTGREHDEFARHLASCAVCREEVASLQSVASSLPSAVEQFEAPPGLKKRVMAAVREDAERAQAPTASEARARSSRNRRGWRGALLPTMVAVAAIVALAVFIAGSGSGGGSRLIRAQVSAPGASASVRVTGDHGQLTLANMPRPAAGRVYEVWVERMGAPAPTDTLFTVTSRGSAAVGVPGSIAGVKEVLVTSEPLGGSRAPTTPPIVVAKLL